MSDTPVWKIHFYGTRGSIPVAEPGYQEFGGNTTCILIDMLQGDKENLAIFDAGTGIRQLGKDILAGKLNCPPVIFLAFTHFHWDHISGFPFFAPFYNPAFEVKIYAPEVFELGKSLKEVFALPLQREYFPVQLDNMGVEFQFLSTKDLKNEVSMSHLDDFKTNLHSHPGGAYGYRLSAYGKTIVLCTDVEHHPEIDERVVEFARDADLLIHDAQYTTEELEHHYGWGHSSYEQAMEVAKRAGAKRLIMTHHDPDHDDNFLREEERKCRLIMPECCLARDGMEVLV